MHNFEFYNPTRVLFGHGMVQRIGGAVAADGMHKVLLVAGGGSIRENGVYQATVASLNAAGVAVTETWGVRANPDLVQAQEIAGMAADQAVDGLLAVGGGSVIDAAKCAAVGATGTELWPCFERRRSIERALPVYTVLTISSSGSEMDPCAFLTNSEQHQKRSIVSPLLYPRLAVIDPAVQTSLPWRQTVNGAVSVLSHIMASYLVGSFEETTLALDETIMKTVIHMVDRLQGDHADYGARANLAWAATLAMNGLSTAGIEEGDWSARTIETAMSALHPEIAYGAGLAVILPAWMQYLCEDNPGQFLRWATRIWGVGTVGEGIAALKATFQRWGAPSALSDLGIGASELRDLAFAALAEGPLGKLRALTARDVVELLKPVL